MHRIISNESITPEALYSILKIQNMIRTILTVLKNKRHKLCLFDIKAWRHIFEITNLKMIKDKKLSHTCYIFFMKLRTFQDSYASHCFSIFLISDSLQSVTTTKTLPQTCSRL